MYVCMYVVNNAKLYPSHVISECSQHIRQIVDFEGYLHIMPSLGPAKFSLKNYRNITPSCSAPHIWIIY